MRRLLITFILAFLLIPALAPAEDLAPMRLGLVEGGVQVMSKDTTEAWGQAGVNTPLGPGDRLWVPDNGRAELQVAEGVYVRADGDTSLDVLRASEDSAQFYTDGGHIYSNNRRGGLSVVQIDTPLVSVRGYDGSVFLLDADGGTTEVQVLRGGVYAENRSGQTLVGAGSTLTIREDGSAELAPMGGPDQWERWNIDRDRDLTAWSESSRYLPDELQGYSPDFDRYGRWGYDNDYGYVWFPVTRAAGWAPYREGRWRWIGGSYVWISDEAWGWAPYHYGRWFFRAGAGWCWVPPVPGSVFWAPGYVGWVRTGPYIGWVPLAPGETYYGYGYYGPSSVNILNIDANGIRARKFRNADFPHGTTFIRRDSLGTHDGRFENPGENPFRGSRFDFRPPEREPSQVIMTRRAPPPGNRPPERIMRTSPEKLREERRLARRRDESVFRPEPPRRLEPIRLREPRPARRGTRRRERRDERGGRRE